MAGDSLRLTIHNVNDVLSGYAKVTEWTELKFPLSNGNYAFQNVSLDPVHT